MTMRRLLTVLACLGLATSAASQSPPKNQAENGPFKAFQFAVSSLEKLAEQWNVPDAGVELTSSSSTQRNKPIYIAFVFAGCSPKADGACDVTADFHVLDPNGKLYAEHKGAPVWSRAPLTPNYLMLSEANLGLRIEDGEALGIYKVRIVIHDNVAKRDVTTEDDIDVSEAS